MTDGTLVLVTSYHSTPEVQSRPWGESSLPWCMKKTDLLEIEPISSEVLLYFSGLSLVMRVNISLLCSAGTALGRLQQEEWEFQAQAILSYMVSSSQIRSQKTSPPIKQTKTKTNLPRSLFLLYFEWQASICCPGCLLLTVFVSCVLDELSFWWGHILFKYRGMFFSFSP